MQSSVTEAAPAALPRAPRPVAGFLRLFTLMLGAVFAVALIGGAATSTITLVVLPWIAAATALYLAPAVVWSSDDIFSPAALGGIQAGFSLLAGVAALVVTGDIHFYGLGSLSAAQRGELARAVCVLHLVGAASYLAGYYASSGGLVARLLPRVHDRVWLRGRIIPVVLVMFVISAVGYVAFQNRVGASLFDVTRLYEGKQVWRNDPTLSWMLRAVFVATVPATLLVMLALQSASRVRLVLAVVVLGLVALLVLRLGQRGPAYAGAVAAVILFHYQRRRISLLPVVALAIAGMGVNAVLLEFRAAPGGSDVAPLEASVSPVEVMAQYEAERKRLSVDAAVLHFFPERKDYLMGESWQGIWATLVPRWIWPEKVAAFQWRDTQIAMNLIGLPAPTPLCPLLYANFSWVGVVLGMGAWGAVHRGLYRWLQSTPRDPAVVFLYVAFLTSFVPTLFGLSLALQYAVPSMLLVYLLTRRKPA